MAGGASGGLYSQSITNYRGGVSQQPSILRYPDQLEEQINAFPSLVEGLQKRPPTIHVKRLGNKIDYDSVNYHVINRDDTEQYILEMSNGNLRVWDMQGNEKTVKFPNGKSYLSVTNARKDFRAITIADYTFILNKTVTTRMKSDRTPRTNENTVLFDVRSAQYGKIYAIYINDNFESGVRFPDGGASEHAKWTTTVMAADVLYDGLNGTNMWAHYVGNTYDSLFFAGEPGWLLSAYDGGITDSYYVTRIGDSVIAVQRKDKQPFEFYIKDGFGGQNFYTCGGSVRSTTKLPNDAPDGYVVKVQGDTEATEDDYYVKWNAQEKLWQECVAEDLVYKIDETTMPWALIREADGTFTFKPHTWTDRKVGDDDSNPEPSFIGYTLNDIFFYRNRLGFLSDENIILSQSDDYFNFWYSSAATINDTDPIDVGVSSNKVSILTDATPFYRELMLFSREGQFVLSSDGVLTPKSVKVDQMTSFNYSPNTRPLPIGQSIFFINDRINFCSLMRYYTVQDVADLKNAEDVSAHVPSYIPKGIYRISGNTTENTILMLSDAMPNYVWVYKFAEQDGRLTQSSWGKWSFRYDGSQVCLAEFVNADMYFLINTDGGLFLEKTTLTGNVVDFPEETVRLFIDRKIKYTVPSSAKFDDYNNTTEINFKNIYGAVPKLGAATYCLVSPEGAYIPINIWDSSTGIFKVSGDVRGKTYFVGRQYEFMMELSEVALKINDGTNVTTDNEGKLQLRNYYFNYDDSGVFDVVVENKGKHQKYTYTNTARFLGTLDTVLGANETHTGKFKVPIHDSNTEVTIKVISNNPLPLSILSGNWEGFYIRKSLRV